MLGVKVALSCFKQLPLNFNLIQELFIHTSLGERLLFAVYSFDNTLDSHSEIVSGRLENVLIVFLTGWNIK